MDKKGISIFRAALLAFILLFSTGAEGADWSTMTSGTTYDLNSIWGSSGTDVFAVGDSGIILHYDGVDWSTMASGTIPLNGIWGSSGTDVFAVGDSGLIVHYDGADWSTMASVTSYDLNGVWGSSGTDVFAVGEYGTILHYDGVDWSAMTSGTTYTVLNGVWGSSGTDVFTVGDGGVILHYDGADWSAITYFTIYDLNGVWGSSGTDVFAVNEEGTILHYDGIDWVAIYLHESSKNFNLNSIWGSSGTNVFVVGEYGTTVISDGTDWVGMKLDLSPTLNGVWGSLGNDVFAVGESGTILSLNPSIHAGIIEGRNTSEYGNRVTIALRLTTEPLGDVTIPVISSDTSEGSVDKSSLIFDSTNFNIIQTVTVTGVNDSEQDGNQRYSIVLGPASSSDDNYNELDSTSIALINLDDWPWLPAPPNNGGSGGCFIATAAYGSYWEPHVMTLRQFRDKYLLTNKLGTKFVEAYYMYSPPMADYIAEHDKLRSVAKIGLAPLVGFSWIAMNFGMATALVALLSILTLLIGGTCLAVNKREVS